MSAPEPFAFTEAELSEDAAAILAYARRWGTPFTRMEITDIAPGAAWDQFSHWPSTVAKLDPIRELVRAGLVEEHDEQPVKSDRRGRRTYKRWKLTGVETPKQLYELLNEFGGLSEHGLYEEADVVRTEILRRFDNVRGSS